MSLTLERIEALAPDQASLAAARHLLKPSFWPTRAEAGKDLFGADAKALAQSWAAEEDIALIRAS
jgi:hypothetical protein